MQNLRLEEKIDDLIARTNRLEILGSAVGERYKEHTILMKESLSQLKVVTHTIEVQVRANQLEIAKLNTQAKLAGGIVGVIAGAISGGLSSLLRGGG